MTGIDVYDTTLRDGAQQVGLSLSVEDKLAIARHLDELGVGYIEGGWPGANPKDSELFRRAATELDLRSATLAAFGATRRPGRRAGDDPMVAALRDSGAPVVTLVAKSDVRHVELALRTTADENLDMVRDTVAHLRQAGQRVFVDAEHFFDGYRTDRTYAMEVLRTAYEAGAEVVALCDTNGGMLPDQVADVVHDVLDALGADGSSGHRRLAGGARLGIHAHNDSGCAVANTMAAVAAGAGHLQGTVNGYGERTGNADLVAVVANLELKHDQRLLPDGRLRGATRVAHAVGEIANVAPAARQPYVGSSAFAHKAGLHASAVRVDPDLYQHTDPAAVGNDMHTVVSDMAGRASIELKGRELGLDFSGTPELLGRVTERVKSLEALGYAFEAADASLELLMREEIDHAPLTYFDVRAWQVTTRSGAGRRAVSQASIELCVAGRSVEVSGDGNGPLNALDAALRRAIVEVYPGIRGFDLVDYRVRILGPGHGTDAAVRVLVETADSSGSWVTVGVGPDIVAASWQALLDGVTFGLHRQGVRPAAAPVPTRR